MLSNRFITEAEASFFRVLRHVVGDRGHILAQVSLGQLLYTKSSDRSARVRTENSYKQKALDFLICDPQSLRPLLAIELDEPSHARARREDRDELLEQLFDAAGLPYIHVLTSRTYDTRELEATVAPHLRAGYGRGVR
jgi:hypothetical protein